MEKMKRVLITGVIAALLIGATTVFAADDIKTPAQVYSELKGVTVEEAYDEREEGKTFGQLAEEEGVLDKFEEAMLDNKKAIIEKRVEDGLLSREKADEFIKIIEEHSCEGPGMQRLGKEYGVGFGKGLNGEGYGNGVRRGAGKGMGRGYGQRWNAETK